MIMNLKEARFVVGEVVKTKEGEHIFTANINAIDKISKHSMWGEVALVRGNTFDEAVRMAITICDALNGEKK